MTKKIYELLLRYQKLLNELFNDLEDIEKIENLEIKNIDKKNLDKLKFELKELRDNFKYSKKELIKLNMLISNKIYFCNIYLNEIIKKNG